MSTIFALGNRVEISGFEDNPVEGRNNSFVLQTFMHAYNTSTSIKNAVDFWLNANPTKNIKIIYAEGQAGAAGIEPPGLPWRSTGEIYIDPEFQLFYVNDKGSVSKDTFLSTLVHELSHTVNNVKDDDSIYNLKGSNVSIANQWFEDLGIEKQASYDAAERELVILKENFQYTGGVEIENAIIGKLSLKLEEGTFNPRNMDATALGITGSTLYIGSLEGDNFAGTGDNDFLYGNDGSDTLNGNGGFDKIYGEKGDDTLIVSDGLDFFDGGIGSDTLSYEEFGSGVDVDVFAGIFEHTSGVVNIEKVKGTNFVDNMRGSSGFVLDGGKGNDVFTMDKSGFALGGDDNDTFLISGYDDTLPTIYGGEGYDKIEITSTAFGSYNMSTGQFFNYDGSMSVVQDIEEVSFKWGTVYGTNGTDHIINTMMGVAYGRGGDDYMTGYSEGIHGGVEGLFGEAGDDYLVSFGADQMFGGADNDTLVGGLQTYIMDGGSGNDKIYVDPNNQITVQIFTGPGNDEVRGYGSSFVDVKYRFTMDYDPYLGGEDGHLISVFDRGDYFEVLTSEGMDKIYDIGFIMFESDMVAGTWNMFFLDEGIAWINPNGPPSSQAMPLSGPYGDAPFTAYDDPMLAMHDYGMPTWKMASIHEMDYHLV